MKNIIRNILKGKLIHEGRVINPSYESIHQEEPLKDSDTIRVYHGFNHYEDAIRSVKFGFSGKEKAKRIYSYESNNNPNGLFVTLDIETAKKFTHPRGKRGVVAIMEINVKVSDLEAPVWPGGSYTVQGQMSQNWKDSEDRHINGTLRDREAAKQSKSPFINGSDRPELAATLAGNENQALFIGDINPNMIKSIFFGESGKHGLTPKNLERLSVKEFLGKFDNHEPESDYMGNQSNKSYEYHNAKGKVLKPTDDLTIDNLKNAFESGKYSRFYDDIDEFIKLVIKHGIEDKLFWPKQVTQLPNLIKDLELTPINENKLIIKQIFRN